MATAVLRQRDKLGKAGIETIMDKDEMTMVGLLEILAFRSGCKYLSDLYQPDFLPVIRRVLRSVSPEQFSLWEWQDAVIYITREQIRFESLEELVNYLNNYQMSY